MGFQLKQGDMEQVFDRLTGGYDIYGPVRMTGEGMYSDTDVVRYGQVHTPRGAGMGGEVPLFL